MLLDALHLHNSGCVNITSGQNIEVLLRHGKQKASQQKTARWGLGMDDCFCQCTE